MAEVRVSVTEDDPFGETAPADYAGVEVWPQEGKDVAATAAGIESLITGGHRPGQIAVLTRINAASHEIADKLRARGIATRVIGGAERFYTRLEVRDVANALDSLADPGANFQLLALLRSPFVGLSLDSIALLSLQRPVIDALPEFEPPTDSDRPKIEEFLSWFQEIGSTADRVPAWEVLSQLMTRTGYLERIAGRPNAEQTLANVRKLFMLAAAEPLLDAPHFAEKIRQIQELRHRESDAPSIDEDADAVTVMTIHKAKGLEFDVVVLPDMHQKFGRRLGEVAIDARTGTVMTRFSKLDTVCFKQLFKRLDDLERDEQLRVLYVGMTRAKKRLCVVTAPSPTERTPAGLVTARMGLHDRDLPGLVVRRPLDA
jgi:ATP-dependent exoDNAse (exonuclease V) beta subunit